MLCNYAQTTTNWEENQPNVGIDEMGKNNPERGNKPWATMEEGVRTTATV